MKYELNDEQVKNLKIFLNRIEYKGLIEAVAAVELMTLLNHPIQEEAKKG